MTVRQAVAVGGGYDIIRLRTGNPVQEASQIKSELAVLWTEVAKEDAIIWRLKSEIGQPVQIDRSVYANAPLPAGLLDSTIKAETDQLQARRAERDRELNYLTIVINQSDRRLELLMAQQKNEEEASKQDIEDFERVTKLFEKGNVAVTRFADSRRAMLLSSTRILQTSAAVSQLEREREELTRQRAGFDDKRKIVVLTELQEAQARLAQAKLKLVSAQERLIFSSKMRNQLGAGTDQKVELVVVRQSEKGRERFMAGEDTELWPGDAIEVAMDLTDLLTFPN
jgi:polysaccharide export outer membrane protein